MLQEISAPPVTLNKAQFLNNALILDESLDRDEWDNIGTFLKTANKAVQWWIGDWLNFGERKWGEMYTQALEMTDYDQGYLWNMKYVSSKVEFSCRHENLSWAHHESVASLPQQQRDYWLDYAEKNKTSRNDLRRLIKGGIKEQLEESAGAFSWFKDAEYKKVQELIKPDYRHFLGRLIDPDETSESARYVAEMEYLWMQERCAEIIKKWGAPG